MDRVTSMQRQGSSHTVKFLELTRIYSKFKDNLICIFEGQDEKYFSPRLNLKIGDKNWNGINSGGRKVVLELYKLLSNHDLYKTSNYCCFIDRDFQDWFKNPDSDKIYITNGYSIENNYVKESVFKSILSCEFNVTEFNEHSQDFEKCVQTFRQRLNEYNQCIHDFNCWVKAHRIMEYKKEAPQTLNVRGVKISDLINVSIDRIERIYSKNPKELFKDYKNLQLCEKAIAEADHLLNKSDVCMSYRGKQQLEFLRLFLTKLREDRVSKTLSFFSCKGRVSLNLSKDNCISELSQYANVPDCLNQFIEKQVLRLAA